VYKRYKKSHVWLELASHSNPLSGEYVRPVAYIQILCETRESRDVYGRK
jgi:hypothetical protein